MITELQENEQVENLFYHSAVLYGQKIYVFGGISKSQATSDFFSYDIFSSKIEKLKFKNPPSKRGGHTAVIFKDKMILHGGFDNKSFNDVFSFDFIKQEWEKVKTKGNCDPSDGHSSFVYKEFMYVFGGRTKSQFRRLDLKSFQWEPVTQFGHPPSQRILQSLVLKDSKVYIYGGSVNNLPSNDFFVFDLEEFKWSKINTRFQEGRYHHSSVIYNEKMYIFGGFSKSNYKKNMFVYDINGEYIKKYKILCPNLSGSSINLWRNQIIIIGSEKGNNLNIVKYSLNEPFKLFHFIQSFQDVFFD